MNKIEILEKVGIPYILKKGKYKRIIIGYYHQNILTIKLPINMPFSTLEKFIEKNINWIIDKQPTNNIKYEAGGKYLFLGREYEITIFPSKYPQIEILKNQMIIYTNNLESSNIKKMISDWRMKNAELVFQEVLNKCFREMNHYLTKYPILEIKKYKSRWGCCYPRKNKIINRICNFS